MCDRMATTIYFFTGTGNSLSISKELCNSIKDCELNPISKIWNQENHVTSSEKVGFIFPLYYWGLPLIIKEFTQKVNFDNSSYIFAVVTAGGEVEGIPFIQLDQILKGKSKRLNASFFITMPSNYIIGGDQGTEEEHREKLLNAKKLIPDIAEIINKSEDHFEISTSERKAKTIEKMNAKFHSRVKESDKFFYADENCTGCGICENVCSLNNIVMKDSIPKWLHNCQQCLACINYCPENSIQYGDATLGKRRYHHPEINPEDLRL